MSEDNRKRNVNRIKKTLIAVFFGLLIFSFILNIVLLIKVWQLDRQITKLYSVAPAIYSEISI